MDEDNVNAYKVLSSFNMESDAEIASKLINFEYSSNEDNIMELLNSINGIGYEIDENVFALPSVSVEKLAERKAKIIKCHHELARRYFHSLTFSKRLQKKLSMLNLLYDILHAKYYSSKVI